jgi:hypothetical protein
VQLPHGAWTGIPAESFNSRNDSPRGCLGKPLDLLSG